MKIIQTETEYKSIRENETISLFLFGTEDCGVCKALKQKIKVWNEVHPEVCSRYVPLERNMSLGAQENILGAPALLVFVDGRESIRKAGHFSLEEVFAILERYIGML